MLENQTLSTQRIIKCLYEDYGIELANLKFLPLGADFNASVYKAQTHDNKFYFIKVKRNYNCDISLAITKLLYEAGIEQIILPIKTIHNQQSQTIDDYTIIVYPFIEGEDGFSREVTNDQWVLLGKALRRVHDIKIPASLQNQIQQETYSDKWRQAIKSFFIHEDIVKSTKNTIESNFVEFIQENKGIIQKLVDRADELGKKVKEQSEKFVLCHSDIHGGNVLIDKNDRIYIVDWDEPIMAPKERDLMFIGGGVANVWNKPHQEMLFYKGYGLTEVNRLILAYYRHERIVEDIAQYYQEILLSSVSNADKQVMYKHFVDMFEPLGVIEIAFKTYESLFN